MDRQSSYSADQSGERKITSLLPSLIAGLIVLILGLIGLAVTGF